MASSSLDNRASYAHARWTTLHTHFVGRCVEEHVSLIECIEGSMTGAGAGGDAKLSLLSELLKTVKERSQAISHFVQQHKRLFGDVDAHQIRRFEALCERLHETEARCDRLVSVQTRTPMKGWQRRKTITFSPSVASPPKPLAEPALRPIAALPHRDRGPMTLAQMHETYNDLLRQHEARPFHCPAFVRRSHSTCVCTSMNEEPRQPSLNMMDIHPIQPSQEIHQRVESQHCTNAPPSLDTDCLPNMIAPWRTKHDTRQTLAWWLCLALLASMVIAALVAVTVH